MWTSRPRRARNSHEGVAETVPGVMRRLANPRHPVDLLDSDDTARTNQCRQSGHHPLRVGHVDEQEPGVGNVERCWLEPSVRRLCLDQCEVREVEFGGNFPGHGDHPGVVVNTYRLTGDTDAVAEEVQYPDRTAPNVDSPPAPLNAYPVEQPGSLSGDPLRLTHQALSLGITGAKHIARCRSDCFRALTS